MKLPARVYSSSTVPPRVRPSSTTRKKPSPWIATSSGLPVVWMAPAVIMLSMLPRLDAEADLGDVGAAEGGGRGGWSRARAARGRPRSSPARTLNPMVLTLAMLFAVTSSIVWWTRRPLIAENIPRIMVI